jgi:hypothetical protein
MGMMDGIFFVEWWLNGVKKIFVPQPTEIVGDGVTIETVDKRTKIDFSGLQSGPLEAWGEIAWVDGAFVLVGGHNVVEVTPVSDSQATVLYNTVLPNKGTLVTSLPLMVADGFLIAVAVLSQDASGFMFGFSKTDLETSETTGLDAVLVFSERRRFTFRVKANDS